MSRIKLPEFIHEVIDDPRQRGILMAGSLALFAVGLTPRTLSPGLPTAQEALRLQPELQNLFLLLAFASTATILLGGLASDVLRHRALLVGGLAVMVVTCLVAVVFDGGPIFYAANFIGIAASGVVLTYGIGSVAIAYGRLYFTAEDGLYCLGSKDEAITQAGQREVRTSAEGEGEPGREREDPPAPAGDEDSEA